MMLLKSKTIIERIKLVRIAGLLIFAPYILQYVLTPGHIIPFLNNPVARLVMFICLGLFILSSFLILRLPKPGSGAARAAIGIYMLCVMAPNILLSVFGPYVIRIGPCNMGMPMPVDEHPNRIKF
jgi:hypothetical protein